MKERIELLRQEFENNMAKATTLAELEAERIAFLGKKGHIAELMKGLRDVADKKSAGQLINALKTEVEAKISEAEEALKAAELNAQIRNAKKYNPSLVFEKKMGSYHPITLATREVEDIFISMGFTIENYDEIVDDYHCFEALNIPKHHPARDMQTPTILRTDSFSKLIPLRRRMLL